jgi:hypothetical protein
MSIRQLTALLSIMLLLWTGLVPRARAQQPAPPRAQPVKQTLLEIPTGSIVQVRLDNEQKLRGKLGALTDSGFD